MFSGADLGWGCPQHPWQHDICPVIYTTQNGCNNAADVKGWDGETLEKKLQQEVTGKYNLTVVTKPTVHHPIQDLDLT